MDRLTKEERSRVMSHIRGVDTKPEMIVRSWLHGAGYRYGLHSKDLPGKPDIVLRARKTIVEIRGCFWHRHPGCSIATDPKSNKDFWEEKFRCNVNRDRDNEWRWKQAGWKVLIVWSCFLAGTSDASRSLQRDVLLSRLYSLIVGPKAFDELGRKDTIDENPLPEAAESKAFYDVEARSRKR